MQHPLQSERLYYREFLPEDAPALLEMDSDPEVHRYLFDEVVTDINKINSVITYIRQQYIDTGIGRMATFETATGDFIGWTGLKLERNVYGHETFYDIGYRLRQKHWGKGYATEATQFFLEYAFNRLNAEKVNAYVFEGNGASRRVLEKCGLKDLGVFMHDNVESVWYEIMNPAHEKV